VYAGLGGVGSPIYFHLTKNYGMSVGCQVLIAVAMDVAIFWYIVPCSQSVNRCFGGTYHPHL
jgi:hypothetical protein